MASKQRIIAARHLNINRFLVLDNKAFDEGELDERSREIAGLAASTAIRFSEGIAEHLTRCKELGMSSEEILDVLNIGLVAGGVAVRPHISQAIELLSSLEMEEEAALTQETV